MDGPRRAAMPLLGNGLYEAKQFADALPVREAELSMLRRFGASERYVLAVQGNLARTYEMLGQPKFALSLRRDVYLRTVKLLGEENENTVWPANNYASSLIKAGSFVEARTLLRKATPVARRVLGERNDVTLKLRCNYANAFYQDPTATLDDLHEAVTTLEDTARIARRVLGGAHPTTTSIEDHLGRARATLALREAVTTLEETARTAQRVFGTQNPLTVEIQSCLEIARSNLAVGVSVVATGAEIGAGPLATLAAVEKMQRTVTEMAAQLAQPAS